jgi:hypothetical protein
MTAKIAVKRISGGTTFKVLFVGFLAFHTISTLFIAILVVVGVLPLEPTTSTATESLTPLFAVVAYLLVGILFSPIWVGVLWLSIWPGIWLYSLFRPMNLRYIPPDEQPGT